MWRKPGCFHDLQHEYPVGGWNSRSNRPERLDRSCWRNDRGSCDDGRCIDRHDRSDDVMVREMSFFKTARSAGNCDVSRSAYRYWNYRKKDRNDLPPAKQCKHAQTIAPRTFDCAP